MTFAEKIHYVLADIALVGEAIMLAMRTNVSTINANREYVPLVHRRMSQHNECVILCPRLFYFKYQSDDGAKSMIKGTGGVWGGTFRSDLEKKGVCAGLCRERCLHDGVCKSGISR